MRKVEMVKYHKFKLVKLFPHLEPPQYGIGLTTSRAFRTLSKELLNTVSLVEQSILNISYLKRENDERIIIVY